MIILDTATKSLTITLGGAATTTELPFAVSYGDLSQTTFAVTALASTDGITTGGTPATLVAAPGAATSRKISLIEIYNADTVDAIVTITLKNNVTLRPIVVVTLAPGSTLRYADGDGWNVLDTAGQILVTTGSGSSGITQLTGDGTAGPGSGSQAFTLAASGVVAATYGSATQVSQVTVDAKGRTTLAANVAIQIAESQVTSLTSDLALKAPLASPALTGTPTAPTAAQKDNSTKLATTAYVDDAVLGQNFKEACKYGTTTALPAVVYDNGASGVGATLTASGFGALSLDGSTPSVGDRILVKNQASTFQNGLYTVTVVGGVATLFVLTRATDFNQSADIITGDSSFITAGSTLSATTWAYTGIDNPVIGTDAITFVQTAGQGALSAGDGITITGNSIAVTTGFIATKVDAAANKATPVDADKFALIDSAAAQALKSTLWSDIKATLKAYFDTIYPLVAFKTIAVSGQSDVVADGTADTLTLVAGSNITLTTSAAGDSVTIAASGGASKVVQIVAATYGTPTNSSSSTLADTGLTVTITPTSASNKILIVLFQNGTQKTNNTYLVLQLNRDGSDIVLIEAGAGFTGTTTTNQFGSVGLVYLDSPATASAVVYKTRFASGANIAGVDVQVGSVVSSIVAIEVTP